MKKYLVLILVLSNFVFSEEPLPSIYENITLYSSTLDDVKKQFGETSRVKVPFGHHDYGLCYTSSSGVTALFSSGPMGRNDIVTGIQIRSNSTGLTCKNMTQELSHCLDALCLGNNQDEVEAKLNKKFKDTTTKSGSKVIGYEYTHKLTEEERKKHQLPTDINTAYVAHNIWGIFSPEGATALGLIKFWTF